MEYFEAWASSPLSLTLMLVLSCEPTTQIMTGFFSKEHWFILDIYKVTRRGKIAKDNSNVQSKWCTVKPPLKKPYILRPPAYEDHSLQVPKGMFHVVEPVHKDHLCIRTTFLGPYGGPYIEVSLYMY